MTEFDSREPETESREERTPPPAFTAPWRLRFGILALAVVVAAVDQAAKAWMSAHLTSMGSIQVFPGLAWELAQNNGAAFGVMEGSNVKLIFASAIAVVLILYWARQVTTGLMVASLGLLLGGAMGNLIDRVRLGHVIDFIAIQYAGRTVFWNFNVADSAITVGACLLAYAWYQSEKARNVPDSSPKEFTAETRRPGDVASVSQESSD